MSVSILIVDDEPDVADLFRQRFRREARQGTYVMHFAASGAEALDRLSEKIHPDRHYQHAGHGRSGIAERDQTASPPSAGDDRDRLWLR
jgi:hypothetical protein